MAVRAAVMTLTTTRSSRTQNTVLQIRCRVKAGASKSREGIQAVTDEAVELCVAAVARDGEANRAVVDVISQALRVPRTSLQIVRGLKSREKTIAVGTAALGPAPGDDRGAESSYIRRLRDRLTAAVEVG